MLLAIDIGNTNVVLGIHAEGEWVAHWRIRTVRDKMPDEYGVLFREFLQEQSIELADIERVILSSVVPPLTGAFREFRRTHRHEHPHRQPGRGGSRLDRQRGRCLRSLSV